MKKYYDRETHLSSETGAIIQKRGHKYSKVLAEIAEGKAEISPYVEPMPSVDELIEAQWNAANAYEQLKLSPNGFTICYQHKDISPKAAVIIDWVNDLWNKTYYPRRQEIVDGGNPSLDYSGCGNLPYSFAEAQQEIKANGGV